MPSLNDLAGTAGLDAELAIYNGGEVRVYNHTSVPGRNAAAAGTLLVTLALEATAFNAATVTSDEARALINGDGETPEVFPTGTAVATGAPTYLDIRSTSGNHIIRVPATGAGVSFSGLSGGNIVEDAEVAIDGAFYVARPLAGS